jgi:hypothetical protein
MTPAATLMCESQRTIDNLSAAESVRLIESSRLVELTITSAKPRTQPRQPPEH